MEAWAPSEFLKALEERFGRCGRHIGSAFTLLVVLGVGAWMIRLTHENAVRPIFNFMVGQGVSEELAEQLLAMVAVYAVLVVAVLLMMHFAGRYFARRAEVALGEARATLDEMETVRKDAKVILEDARGVLNRANAVRGEVESRSPEFLEGVAAEQVNESEKP